MKIADIDPVVTEWREGRSRTVGAWSFQDMVVGACQVRTVRHYRTVMFVYVTDRSRWVVMPMDTGWGSVSDQGGVNKLVQSYGWRYCRDLKGGGPRYERLAGWDTGF
jgi:hypothetical protein